MSSIATFRARFEAMVATLRAHPQVEVYEVVIRPRATNASLRDAEAAIGRPLPPALREFYEAHDGIFLEWGLRDGVYERRTDPFDYPDYAAPPGCINLVPVAEAMSSRWEDTAHVNEIEEEQQAEIFGVVPEPQPQVRAVCVDNFSKYNHGDLIFGPETMDPVMIASTDHGADMNASDWVSFPTYLDITLAIFGANRYYHGIGIGWSRDPAELPAWTKIPSLDALLAELVEKT